MGYTTIYEEAQASFTEKKSEFIGHIAPVSTADEAVAFINRIKAENRKARHNVYAYVLREGNVSRYSDDGEPQGTGGVFKNILFLRLYTLWQGQLCVA